MPGRAMSRSTRSGVCSPTSFRAVSPSGCGEHLETLVLEDARDHLQDLGLVVNY